MNIVCFLAGNYYKNITGGAELQMYFLAQEFIKRGWEVHYLTTDVKKDIKYVDDNIVIHGIEKGSVKNVEQTIETIKPNLLYLRSRHKNLSFYMKYALKANIPYIYAFASDYHIKKNFGLNKIKNDIIKGKLLSILKIKYAYINDQLFSELIAKSLIITTQNSYQFDGIKRITGKHQNIILQQNVFPYKINKNSKDIRKHKVVILWLSNMKPWKHPKLFLELAKIVADESIELLMIGRCDDLKLLHQINKLKETNISFNYIGPKSQNEVFEFLKITDILINTSLAGQEGFPNTFIQAWFHSIPVITLEVDPDNLISKHKLGLNANSSFDQLVAHTKKLISDTNLRKKLGKNAFNFANQNFTTKNYNEMFQKLKESQLFD